MFISYYVYILTAVVTFCKVVLLSEWCIVHCLHEQGHVLLSLGFERFLVGVIQCAPSQDCSYLRTMSIIEDSINEREIRKFEEGLIAK